MKDVLIHSLQVIACLILIVAKISDATIKHRLHWDLQDPFPLKSGIYFLLLHNPRYTYTPQAYDGDENL